ncbi:MAG: 50S ribosomal protein L11 methyltransferase [Prochlorococcaceae cyanobacterium]|jgi:ribosomal protein L11 methyltransferase
MTHTWWRLEMDAPAELEESLLWKLQSLGVGRVAIQSSPSAPELHCLLAWLPEIDWPEDQRLELVRALEPLGEPFALALPPVAWHRQAEEDWSLTWKQHWQPDPLGRRLLILPAWLELPPEHADRLVIRMDPGSAFGTGSHPTTRLCLEATERLAEAAGGSLAGWRVADLGCGSGILGFGALRLGAAALRACDTDPLAVRATIENAALNGIALAPAGPVRVAEGSVEALEELLEGRSADLLLCNILAPVIEALAPRFAGLLAPGGVGLLSGLLVDQAPLLEGVLEREGWAVELSASESRWGLLTIRRRSDVA